MTAVAIWMVLGGCADAATGDATIDEARAEAVALATEPPQPGAPGAGELTFAPRGGAQSTPVDYDDPDLRCYPLTAFQSVAQRGDKFAVPTIPDYYVKFSIKAPWQGKQYIRAFRNIIDNKAVLHHWLLYRQTSTADQREGPIADGTGAHPDGELLYGWAPGGEDLYFHQDVGMAIEEGTYFQLENHYNNTKGAPTPDGSGVEVCVTPHAPEHLAGMAWLGTDRIKGISATGTCTPETTEPVHVLLATPHMHKSGVHMKVDWQHADGSVETVHDESFDFDYQRSYTYENFVVQPGDKLTTTCRYATPAQFGKGTNDEMCYFFTIHWPAGKLAMNNFFTKFHGGNTCLSL